MEPRRSLNLLRLGVATAIVALVSACSNTGAATTAPTTGPVATSNATAAPPTPAATDTPPDQVTGSLQVTDWTGYDTEWAWQDFKNTYKNATVTFDFADTDADQFSKAKAGGQDIIHPYSGWLQLYVDQGLVAEELLEQQEDEEPGHEKGRNREPEPRFPVDHHGHEEHQQDAEARAGQMLSGCLG